MTKKEIKKVIKNGSKEEIAKVMISYWKEKKVSETLFDPDDFYSKDLPF